VLDQTFFALANDTRRALIERLLEGDATVGQLAEPLAMTLPAVSKHLTVLERAGIVRRERHGRTRICRVCPERLDPAAEWLERHRFFWKARLEALDEYLAATTGAHEEEDG
jgi:DNA-binding transcriptional ArsR family regulator